MGAQPSTSLRLPHASCLGAPWQQQGGKAGLFGAKQFFQKSPGAPAQPRPQAAVKPVCSLTAPFTESCWDSFPGEGRH